MSQSIYWLRKLLISMISQRLFNQKTEKTQEQTRKKREHDHFLYGMLMHPITAGDKLIKQSKMTKIENHKNLNHSR